MSETNKKEDRAPETENTSDDTAAEVAVSVRNLTKDYKIYSRRGQRFKELLTFNRREFHETKRALHNINVEVERGECLGVIGNNGSGKSTLLKIVAGTSYPTAGDLAIHGNVSYILDPTTGFNPDFSGRENIFIKCALLGLPPEKTHELFNEIHAFSGLINRIDHPIKSYSAGMLMRLGFSVAIHVPFDVLLVDEILSVGDYRFQRKCINAIRAFRSQGKTIIISSHNLADVATFCNRLLLLHDGEMAMLDRTDKVVQIYLEECEKSFSEIETRQIPIHDDVLACCTEKVGKAKIQDVTFYNAEGEETTVIKSGTGITVRVRFQIDEPVDNPCIRVQFLRNDGLLITGSNTYRHGINFGVLQGTYEALCHFNQLNLLNGDYYVNVGLWPDEYQSWVTKTPYDAIEYQNTITMVSGRVDGGGMLRSPNGWTLKDLEKSS